MQPPTCPTWWDRCACSLHQVRSGLRTPPAHPRRGWFPLLPLSLRQWTLPESLSHHWELSPARRQSLRFFASFDFPVGSQGQIEQIGALFCLWSRHHPYQIAQRFHVFDSAVQRKARSGSLLHCWSQEVVLERASAVGWNQSRGQAVEQPRSNRRLPGTHLKRIRVLLC